MKIKSLGSNKKRINQATLKNKVRGAFSLLTERRPSVNPNHNINSMRRAAHAVNAALSIAKSSLSKDELHEFEKWVEIQSRSLHSPKETGVAWEVLGVLPEKIHPVRLGDALQQSLDALSRQRVQLEDFSLQLQNVNSLIDSGEFFAATEAVDRIIKKHDYSYWAIEAKIALLFSTGRASDAKEFIKDFSIAAPGLNAFHLYHFGMRNESSQSSSRFKSIVKRRLTDSSLSAEYQRYALYRTARIIENTSEGLAAVLSYELLTTKADLLLTSRRVALQILCNSEFFSEREIALCRELMRVIPDESASIINTEQEIVIPHDLSVSVEIAIRHCIFENNEAGTIPHVEKLAKGLAAVFSYSGSEADEDALRKECINFWWRINSMLIESAQSIIRLPDIFASSASISNDLAHPLNIKCVSVFEKYSTSYIESLNTPAWDNIDSDKKRVNISYSTSTVIDCISVRDAWKALEDFEYERALKIIQFALFKNIRLLHVLPLERMFGGKDPNKIRSYGTSVYLCNCLHWYSQINTDRKIKTDKRYAIEYLIREYNAVDLINLATIISSASVDKRSIEYFLSSTCDVGTIELIGDTDGTIESLEIRAKLLRLAASISADSSAQLIADADSIDEQLQLDNVLQELDKTKVSVDEEALIPIVAREISGDFERYKKLKPEDSAITSSVEDLVISLKQQSASTFQIPKSEADDLLVQMIYTVLDRFIDDPVYGLEAIVGRRIRHGTISDELRGTLEQVQLIGHRPRSGVDYKTPNAARTAVEHYDSAIRVGVNRAFNRFSSSIDNLVATLRDEVFYSRQPKLAKPKKRRPPVFELPVGVLVVAIARDAANTSSSVENFIRELFDTFWFQLSTSVERYRPQIGDFIAASLTDSFSKLQFELKAAGYLDATFLAKIQRASEDLQIRGEIIKDWIRIPKISSEGKTYPLNMVYDAAMAFVKSKRPGFEPESSVHIAENVNLDAHGFPIAFDAVRIAIENIAKHSGLKQNRLDVKIELNPTEDKLCFSFVSGMSKENWTRERAIKLEAIKDDIRRHTYSERAKRTSESGIAKLATIVMQRANCKIDFGPDINNLKFKLYFELVYVAHDLLKGDEAAL